MSAIMVNGHRIEPAPLHCFPEAAYVYNADETNRWFYLSPAVAKNDLEFVSRDRYNALVSYLIWAVSQQMQPDGAVS